MFVYLYGFSQLFLVTKLYQYALLICLYRKMALEMNLVQIVKKINQTRKNLKILLPKVVLSVKGKKNYDFKTNNLE